MSRNYKFPCGPRHNPANWADFNVKTPRLITRGYFGLINMNGRMYDPVIGRILSPDPFVSSPSYTQSYNRYTYCFNNPLKYTDPSGWIAPESDGPEVVWNAPGFGPGPNHSIFGTRGSGGLFGLPGEDIGGGTNGTGLNGVYYDWISGTYLSTDNGHQKVSFDDVYRYCIVPNSQLFNSLASWEEYERNLRTQKEFEDKQTLAAVSNIGYGKSFGGPYDDIVEIMKEIWYSPIVMRVIPDLITLSFDPSCTVVLGLGVSFQLNILTRGMEPGIFMTNTVTKRTLFMGDFSLNLGAATYQGNYYTMTRSELTGTTQDLGGGLLLGVNVWRSLNNSGDAMWYGWKSGFGGTLGISYGTGNTNIGWQPDIFSLGHTY